MMLTPGGAVLVGAIAALLSVCGFRFADADADHPVLEINCSPPTANYSLLVNTVRG